MAEHTGVVVTGGGSAGVTAVGAGPTGIETAAELAERGRRVILVCGGVLGPYLHPRRRRAVTDQLAHLGVTVLAGSDATVTAVTRDSVAVGDSAAPSGLPFRTSCQAAGPLGVHAADTVLSRLAGRDPAPVALGFAGQCISLGREAGVFQFAHRNDTANRFYLSGRPGAKLEQLVCWSTVKQLALEARRPGSCFVPSWATDDQRQLVLQARHGNALAATTLGQETG